MRVIQPEVYVRLRDLNEQNVGRGLEEPGRTCYKSEDRITEDSYEAFLEDKVNIGHFSLIEHEKMTVKFVVDRGVSHELVRHRLASFSQESTRYCNYSKDKFGNEITVIEPFMLIDDDAAYDAWFQSCEASQRSYFKLLGLARSAQEARSVLPNSLKTEIWMTANFREWREVFEQRCSIKAHPQMRQVMLPLYYFVNEHLPFLFSDIQNGEKFDRNFPREHFAQIYLI